MIEISLYYIIGTSIVLPSITFLTTRLFYINKINKIDEEIKKEKEKKELSRIILEHFNDLDIEDMQELKSPDLNYNQKREKIEEHFKKINENIVLQ